MRKLSIPIGFPFWRLFARMGVRMNVVIDVYRDKEKNVFQANGRYFKGLVVEADTYEQLMREVNLVLPDVIKENYPITNT